MNVDVRGILGIGAASQDAGRQLFCIEFFKKAGYNIEK
jgi:hypothetical protein